MSIEMDPNAKILYRSEPLRKPVLQDVIKALQFPAGSRGLDVGCGIGLQSLLLAQAIGQHGHVTGLDAYEPYLESARAFAAQANLADRTTFRPGNWNQIPFERGQFDWVWSADAAGYAPALDPTAVIGELARVVKPGGRVVLAIWSSQTLLPGYPLLEARLNASAAGIAPFPVNASPETHFMRTLGAMRSAGLAHTHVESAAHSISAPLDQPTRDALTDLLQMRWGTAQADLSPQDWQAYQRLSHPDSPDFIVNCPDYHAIYTYSVFSGTVTEKGGQGEE